MAKFDRYEILTRNYISQIESWDWEAVLKEVRSNCFLNDCDEIEGRCYLGSVLNLYPSGKYYMPWCTNQTRNDEIKDSCYQEALEKVANDFDLFITGSDGDGLDVCAGQMVDYDDVIQWITSEDADKAEELFNECEQECEDEVLVP